MKMLRKIICLISGSFMFVPMVVAQDCSADVAERIMKAGVKSTESVELLSASFGISDINNDGFVSENELAMIINNVDAEIGLTANEKSAKKERLRKYFAQADKNNDHRLDKKEYIVLAQKEIEFEAKAQVAKAQSFANKSPEEIDAEIEANAEKIKSALNKLKEIPTEELANNFISGISNAMADENYFQMDRDKNGCVTEEEYVNYMLIFAENTADSQGSGDYQMTKDDWREMYHNEKKTNPTCLTKEEYINNFNDMLEIDYQSN